MRSHKLRRELNSENMKAEMDLKEGMKPNLLLHPCTSETKLRPREESVEVAWKVPHLVGMK